MNPRKLTLEDYFIRTGFYDLLPMAMQIAEDLRFNREEMIEAVCKVISLAGIRLPEIGQLGLAWFIRRSFMKPGLISLA